MPVYIKRSLYALGGLVIFIIVFIALFIGYLQLSTFGLKITNYNATKDYINHYGIDMLNQVQEDNYQALLPLEVLNEEVTKLFIQAEYSRNIDVNSANLNLMTGKGQVNYKVNGFYVPINCNVSYNTSLTGYSITVTAISYGKLKLNMPKFIDSLFYREIFNTPVTIDMDPSEYSQSVFFEYQKSEITEQGLIVNMTLNLPYVDQFMMTIKESVLSELTDIYENGTPEQVEALQWINLYSDNKEDITSRIFEDFRKEGKVLKELIVLAEPLVIKSIYSEYSELNSKVKQEDIIVSRNEVIGDAIVVYTQMLLEDLKTYTEEASLVQFRDQIFDLDQMEVVDEVTIRNRYGLDIGDSYLADMHLMVKEGKVVIIYDTHEGSYIEATLGGFTVIDESEYLMNTTFEKALKGQVTEDGDIYDGVIVALESYYSQKVFLRYLADDGQQVFAYASTIEKPQTIVAVALEKNEIGEYVVLGSGYTTIYDLNQELTDFNLNLTNRDYESLKFKKLNASSISKIKEGLVERGYLSDDETLDFYSYDGSQLIYLQLSSGEEYIYTVYRSQVLEEVYTLEEAYTYFDYINPLLMVLSRPGM